MEEATITDEQALLRLAARASRAEQFSLWAMRLWWCGFPELDSAWPDLVQGFRVCGVAPAIEAFHRFCSVGLAAGVCGGGIACMHCPRISRAEEQLLDAFAAANDGNPDLVESLLRNIVPASVARLMVPHAVHFAQILTHAGLLWPQPTTPPGCAVASSPRAEAPTFSLTLH